MFVSRFSLDTSGISVESLSILTFREQKWDHFFTLVWLSWKLVKIALMYANKLFTINTF